MADSTVAVQGTHKSEEAGLDSDRLETGQTTPAPAEKVETEPTREIRGVKWALVCLALYISAFIYGLDTTIAADVQSDIIAEFGHVDQLAWIGAGFPLGSVSVILIIGTLYYKFNMKWVFVASVVMFEIGSTLCGAAPNMNAIIVGRVIAGMGGSGIYLGCLNYYSTLASEQTRPTYIAATGACWGLGAVLGPLIGGGFAVSSATWRWAFYINLVIAAVTAPIFFFCMPSIHPVKNVSIIDRIKTLDFVGYLLGIGFWVSFTIAFTFGGGQWAWSDGRTIATIVVWGVILVAWISHQVFSIGVKPENRSFPVDLIKSRTQIMLYIATSANVTATFVVVYFIPIYFQFTRGDSALLAAVRLLPFIVLLVTVNLAVGWALPRISHYVVLYIVSGILILIGSVLLVVFLSPDASESSIYGYTVLIGIGGGLTVQCGYSIAVAKADDSMIGSAINLQNVSQIGTQVFALVIAGQIFQSVAAKNLTVALASSGLPQAAIESIVAGTTSAAYASLSPELKVAAVLAVTEAMRKAFIVLVVAGAVELLAAFGMRFERTYLKAVAA